MSNTIFSTLIDKPSTTIKTPSISNAYSIVKRLVIMILMTHILTINAQNKILTLQEALSIGLSSNDQIVLANMNADASGMQVYKANAGLVPRIDWNVNVGSALNQVNQKFVDGRLIDRSGRTIAPSTNLALSWTLYDGNKMQTRYEILKQQHQFAQINANDIKEQLTDQISTVYYNIVRLKETLKYLQSIIKYYEERLTITKARWDTGRGSKLDYLQSQNDLNTQLSSIQQAEMTLQNEKVTLNLLLNRDISTEFDVEAIQENTLQYDYEMVYALVIKNSEALMALDKEIEINQLQGKDLKGNDKPRVNLITSLGYSLNNTNAGLILLNQNIGINAGINSTWNIFDGKHNSKQMEINKFNGKILEREKNLLKTQLSSQVLIAINQWNSDKKIFSIEEKNKILAEENLTIAIEKFKLGSSTILELNDAQQRFDAAVNRYVNAFFNVKNAELRLENMTR